MGYVAKLGLMQKTTRCEQMGVYKVMSVTVKSIWFVCDAAEEPRGLINTRKVVALVVDKRRRLSMNVCLVWSARYLVPL